VPRDLPGRVASIDALGSDVSLPDSLGAAGITADHIGASPVFVLSGAISALLIGCAMLDPAVRGLD